MQQREIRIYKTAENHSPFEKWLNTLTMEAQVRVQTRLDRAEAGNFGDYKALKDGVFEFRIHALAGLRIYFAIDGNEIILLLCGGTKRTQKKDIKKAKEYWCDYLTRRLHDAH